MANELGYQFKRVFAEPIEEYRKVATIVARDAIPTSVRYQGMLCYVVSENQDYQLRGGTTNGDWVNSGAGNYFDMTTNDSDDINEGVTNLFMTTTERTKLGYVTVTQAVDLDALETAVNALGGGVLFKGVWSPSGGVFPGGGVTAIGDLYIANDSGTIDGVSFVAGDGIIALVVNASTTTFAANWVKNEAVAQVTSVVGLTGAITKSALLAALNVEDGAEANPTNAEIVAAIDAELTNTDWQQPLTKEQVLDFIGEAIADGTQTGITVTYDDANDAIDFEVKPFMATYANLAALVLDQANQFTDRLYRVTDGTDWGTIAASPITVKYLGTTNGDETDYRKEYEDAVNASYLGGQADTYFLNTDNHVAPTVAKTTPVGADLLTIWDSAASFVAKKLSFTNLGTYLDGIYEKLTNKDATGGYVGMTLFKINFKNAANTFTSYFTNSNTASRTYTFKDADGTVAFVGDNIDEEKVIGTAVYNATLTGATNIDLNSFSDYYGILTGNTTITFTNTPASGKTVSKTMYIKSTTTQTLTFADMDYEIGTYLATGVLNAITVNVSNFPTVGLIVRITYEEA